MLDRAAFIDQSQSFSVYIKNADVKALVKHHFFTWSNGAKTGKCLIVRIFLFILKVCITTECNPLLWPSNFRSNPSDRLKRSQKNQNTSSRRSATRATWKKVAFLADLENKQR